MALIRFLAMPTGQARAYQAGAPDAYGKVFNLGSPERIGLKDLAALMVQLFAGGAYEMVPFPADRKAIDIGDYYSDYTKAKAALKWEPAVGLQEGLERTLSFYRLHYRHYWE